MIWLYLFHFLLFLSVSEENSVTGPLPDHLHKCFVNLILELVNPRKTLSKYVKLSEIEYQQNEIACTVVKLAVIFIFLPSLLERRWVNRRRDRGSFFTLWLLEVTPVCSRVLLDVFFWPPDFISPLNPQLCFILVFAILPILSLIRYRTPMRTKLC